MDNLQTQASGAATTGNPQAIGQTSLVTGGSNLQPGTVGSQTDLSKLSVNSLSVAQCTENCTLQTIALPKPTSDNSGLVIGSLIFTLLLLAWLTFRWLSKSKTPETKVAEAEAPVLESSPVVAKPKPKPPVKKRKKAKSKKRRR